ncbi:DUF6090 family protein [Fulvivirga sedimenti]|uniref:Uncharacterized protein n=1 Tax=Fulvivirga sedimenti TaxID=2879465 RepID=A0A9X1L0L4_9BACT|nr:DUF6090 family protein [Fulvivirga sedimenti]MCA6075052.1 hypothetical protein [Fulvivirga sedimenti]MCA6076229.1 hypothetical protein [Fulvivirga sedimenti]MCA6077357.1 hypothetical protein [Fulvivirga sedimenti]
MISFFRKIRQKLLAQNRLSKYLLYALGEILLVVIGILIALQINTWNDAKKQSRLEQEYYCRLLEDALQDKEQLIEYISLSEARIITANEALRLLQKETTRKAEIGIQINRSISAIYVDFRPNNSAFEDLKSGANLNIIGDKSIIKALNHYFNKIESYFSIVQVNGQKAVDLYYDQKNNFENGWLESNLTTDRFLDNLDKDVLESLPIDNQGAISDEIKRALYIDALYYFATNTRQKELYHLMKNENAVLIEILNTKCAVAND